MAAHRGVIVTCDQDGCTNHYVHTGPGGIGAARSAAIYDNGWVRRGNWDLCPDHRDVRRITITTEFPDQND